MGQQQQQQERVPLSWIVEGPIAAGKTSALHELRLIRPDCIILPEPGE